MTCQRVSQCVLAASAILLGLAVSACGGDDAGSEAHEPSDAATVTVEASPSDAATPEPDEQYVIEPLPGDTQANPIVMPPESAFSADDAAAAFNGQLARAVDEVAQEGRGVDDLRDLAHQKLYYLVPDFDLPGMSQLVDFVTTNARTTQEATDKWAKTHADGYDIPPSFGIWTTTNSTEQQADGTIVVTDDDQYKVISPDGDILAQIEANGSSQEYTFSPALIHLPSGDGQHTYVLTGFDFTNDTQ